MNRYDNFNPTIPDIEEPGAEAEVKTEELPAQTVSPSKAATKPDKKKRRPKPATAKKTAPKTPQEPFGHSIKAWANSQTTRWLTGLFLGFFGVYLGISFFSYFSECVKDQSEILNAPFGQAADIANRGGEGGARISEFLINQCFGLGSIVIVFWLLAMAMKLLTGHPKFKSVNFTIKAIVALITVSLIVGQLTVGLQSPVNWGGYHGRYVNEFIRQLTGDMGCVVVCIFMVCVFVVICLRDVINWVITLRKKRQEKRRLEAERKALELEKERQEEEMRLFEMRRAQQAAAMAEAEKEEEQEQHSSEEKENNPGQEEPEQNMLFSDDDTFFYSQLPDFDDEENPENTESPEASDTSETSGLSEHSEYSVVSEVSDNSDNFEASEINEVSEASKSPDPSQNPDDNMVVNVNTIARATGPYSPYPGVLPGMHPYNFPPAEILREGKQRVSVDAMEQLENKEKIKRTLLDFGIPITRMEATVGPTVTLYEIVPERGVKLNKIKNLADDIALRIAAEGVRIIAPIPGKGTVGIEVANHDPQTVSMRTIVQSKTYQESKYILPIAIGSTISNEVYICDLAKMPHLLVAGATGQGKSVGLNAIIASLLYRKTPDELKFVMVDPKMVEFSLYAKIESHYLAKIPEAEDAIITDMDKVIATLNSLCQEMDDRYQLMKAAHTRNIVEYNEKIREGVLNPAEGHKFMPYIVSIVDEFSDLIMTAGRDVETPIARLGQKGRASGMHVIIATQRPSTNVITGIIKANFPARIAFKVSSGIDSKTILDTTGAQQLIGRGDMLIFNSAPMVRVQCAFIDTPEVEEICDYISRQPYGQGAYLLPEPKVTGQSGNDSEMGNNFGDRDPLFEEVARLIVSSNTASTSSLQRRYSIGYNRAGKIMDQLEAAGIVGPAMGGKPRAVLVDQIGLEAMLGTL